MCMINSLSFYDVWFYLLNKFIFRITVKCYTFWFNCAIKFKASKLIQFIEFRRLHLLINEGHTNNNTII